MRKIVLIAGGLACTAAALLVAVVAVTRAQRPGAAAPIGTQAGDTGDAAPDEQAPRPAAIGYFEPHAGGCAWYRRALDGEADAAAESLGVFPCDCNNVQWSWAPGEAGGPPQSAVVWFDTETYGAHDELLFDVDLVAKKHRRLPVPERGDGVAYVKDRGGGITALTMDYDIVIGEDEAGQPQLMTEDGRVFAPHGHPDGTDVLVHALAWRGGRWELIETKASRCCEGGAPGIQALDAYTRLFGDPALAPLQSRALLRGEGPDDFTEVAAADLKAKLAAALPKELAHERPRWLALRRPDWAAELVFRGTGDGRRHASGLAFLVGGEPPGAPRPPPSFAFAPTDVLRLTWRGPLLLAAEAGTGMRPVVYEMNGGTLRFAARLGHGGALWP